MNKKLKNWYLSSSGVSVDTDYQAVLTKATSLGYTLPSASQQAKQNTLVLALKSAGASLDGLESAYYTAWNTYFTSI
jgi:hypothetical protein